MRSLRGESCRQNDKAVSEQMGGQDSWQALPWALTSAHSFLLYSFMHSAECSQCQLGPLAGTWGL